MSNPYGLNEDALAASRRELKRNKDRISKNRKEQNRQDAISARNNMNNIDSTMKNAASGFGLSREQTKQYNSNIVQNISGAAPQVDLVNKPEQKKLFSNKITTKPVTSFNPRPKLADMSGLSEAERYNNLSPTAKAAMNIQYDSDENFIYNMGRDMLAAGKEGINAATNRQRNFQNNMAAYDRQIQFYDQKNRGQTDQEFNNTISGLRNSMASLTQPQVDKNGFAIKEDPFGRRLNPGDKGYALGKTRTNDSVRLDFGGEALDPFTGGINDQGVTYAVGSKMDQDIKRAGVMDELRQRNPNMSEQDLYDLAEIQQLRSGGVDENLVADSRLAQFNKKQEIANQKTTATAAILAAQNKKITEKKTPYSVSSLGKANNYTEVSENGIEKPTANFTFEGLPGKVFTPEQAGIISSIANMPKFKDADPATLYNIYKEYINGKKS